MVPFSIEQEAGFFMTRGEIFSLTLRLAAVLFVILVFSGMHAIASSRNSTEGLSSSGFDTGSIDPIRWGPYITGTTSDSTIIHVWTHEPIPVTLEYSPAASDRKPGRDPRTLASGIDTVHHIFVLKNLESGTWFNYRVIAAGTEYGDFRFMTYPVSGPVSFVVYGDTRDELPRISQEDRHRPVAEAIAAEPGVALVVHTGDLVYDGGNISDWDRFFTTGAMMLANTTFAPVMGNHEQNNTLFYEIFGTQANYTVDAGDTLLVMLDSNDRAWTTLPAQSAWLYETLSHDTAWKFVTLHHPVYSSEEKHWGGYENLREEWEPIFQASGVAAIFQGHVHLYERDVANGITYITEARGGAPWYTLAEQKIPEYRMSSVNTLGYTLVRIDEETEVVHVRVMTLHPGEEPGEAGVRVIEDITLCGPLSVDETSSILEAPGILLPAHFRRIRCSMDMLVPDAEYPDTYKDDCKGVFPLLFPPTGARNMPPPGQVAPS